MDERWLKTKANEVRTAVIILSKAQISRDSIKNAFYGHFKRKKVSPRLYNTVYWLVMETARKHNLLDEYTRTLGNNDPFVKNLAMVLVFSVKEATYKEGRPVDLPAAREIASKILHSENKPFLRDFLAFLDDIEQVTMEDLMEDLMEGKNSVEKQSLIHGFPQWMVRLFTEKLGAMEAERVMKAGNSAKKTWIRRNSSIVSEERFINSLVADGYAIKTVDAFPLAYELLVPGKRKAFKTSAYKKGWFEFQGLSSIAMASMIAKDCQSADIILELAA
ncbi:MAG: hypothetical protein ACTSP4_09690, partial [Candidatus Hodarchaeales archaeon]